MVDLLARPGLRYLFHAVRLGSVRSAADILDINPSVISRQIARLELELGACLIERLPRGIRATEAGQVLVERYRQWSVDQDDAISKLRDLNDLRAGHVDLTLGEGFVSDLMSGPLNGFWERHPQLSMSLNLAGTNEVVHAVVEDRCHIGLVYNATPHPGIRTTAAIRQPICLIAHANHPLALRGIPVSLREVESLPVGLMLPGYGTRQIVAQAENQERIWLTPKLTTNSINVLRQFVRTGLGVTLLPAFAIASDIAQGMLVALPLRNSILEGAEAKIITRTGRKLPPAAVDLLRYLTAQMLAFRSTAG
ncbi:LysR Transcriptional regulator [Rhabdaerophilaceae bacterium]